MTLLTVSGASGNTHKNAPLLTIAAGRRLQKEITMSIPRSGAGATDIVSRVRISDVWQALGGGPLRHGRARAFWRDHADGLNVALNDDKGTWYDHARGEGGGIIALVQHVRGGTPREAVRWLAQQFGLPLDEPEWTPAQRADWNRRRNAAKRDAQPLAQCALWWLESLMVELEEIKAAAIQGDSIDVPVLAYTSRELHRLYNLTPTGILEEYGWACRQDGEGTALLVLAGRFRDDRRRRAVTAVLARIEEMEGLSNAA